MRNKHLVAAAVFVVIVIVFALILLPSGFSSLINSPRSPAKASELTASGFIEAEQIAIASEFGGKIKDLAVGEGDRVKAGQALASLDDSILERQITQAETAVEVARANLDLVKAGAREEEIKQRTAALDQAEAARDGARTAWDNAIALRNHPQDINSRIVAAQGNLDVAERNTALSKKVWDNAINDYEASLKEAAAVLKAANLQVEQARINVIQAERLRLALQPPITPEDWLRPPFGIQNTLQYDLNVLQSQMATESLALAQANREAAQSRLDKLTTTRALVDVTQRQYDAAVASREAVKAVVDDLIGLRQNPLTLKSQADSAGAAYQQALAAVEVARAALNVTLAGARPEQIRVAEAQVKQAESAWQLLQTQKEKMTITSPADGVVAQKVIEKGEIVLPGGSLLKIVNLETVTLKVFIPETQIGQLKLGSPARVMVDSYPERRFSGRVTFISPQAEFTPKDIQTKEERAKTVFAVKITLNNPEGILKPGMPADATID